MTRADAWIRFAAAWLTGAGAVSIEDAAEHADSMLVEFDKRFEPVPYGVGNGAPLNSAPDTFQATGDKGDVLTGA